MISPVVDCYVNDDVTDYVTSTCHVTCGGGGLSSVSCSCQGALVDHAFHLQSAAYSVSTSDLDEYPSASRPQQILSVYDLDCPNHTVKSQRHTSAAPEASALLDAEADAANPPSLTSRPLEYAQVKSIHDQHHHSTATDHLPECIGRQPAYETLDVRNQNLNSTSRTVPTGNWMIDASSRDCLKEKFSPPPLSSHDSQTSARCSSDVAGHRTSTADLTNVLLTERQQSHSRDGLCYLPCSETNSDQRLYNALERERLSMTNGHDASCGHLRSTASIVGRSFVDGRRSVISGRRSVTEEEMFVNEHYDADEDKLKSDRVVHTDRAFSQWENAVSASRGQYTHDWNKKLKRNICIFSSTNFHKSE